MQKFTKVFESVDAMVEFNTQALKAGGREFKPWSTHGNSWVGRAFKSWEEVVEKAGAAWPEGITKLEAMARELSLQDIAPPVSCKRRPRWSMDSGDEICNDRLRSGQDYWRELRRESSRAPRTITLVAKVGGPASMDSEQLLWSGAAALVLANLLEGAGYRVEILGVRSSTVDEYGQSCWHATWIKRAAQPFDMATLTNAISEWLIRTAWYQTAFSERAFNLPNEGRIGLTAPLAQDREEICEAVGGDDWIGIEEVYSRVSALAKVRGVIKTLDQ